MAWTQLIWFIVTTLVSIALAPKPKPPRAAAIDDFDFPTAEEGRPLPVVFGTWDISGPNVLWYGDLSIHPIRKRSGFSKQTVGYKYNIGFHLGLCHGPVDAITQIAWGEKTVWTGNVTDNATVVIDNTGVWGGEKRGGGVKGPLDFMMGAPTQEPNEYLTLKQGGEQPGYRGTCGLVWRGGYVGTSESVRPIKIRARRILSGWNGDVWYAAKASIDDEHMNPAHMCYQIMTDTEWGMGSPIGFLNDTIWKDAADTFFDEGFGLSLLWNQQTTIEEFLKIVLDHCSASIALRTTTGQFELVPVRGGYDPADLVLLDPSNIKELIDYQRQGWGETVNEVTLVYTDPATGADTTISAHDLGNQEAQQRRVPATVELRGIRKHDIAEQVVQRELSARVTPLGSGKLLVNRDGWRLPYNSVFRLTWPERGLLEVPHRILSISRGSLLDNYIEIDFIEDIYGLELGTYLSNEPDSGGEDSPDTPEDGLDPGNGVISTTQPDPPVNPYEGDSYYVPDDATGDWAGHSGQYADWDENENDGAGGWVFTDVPDGTIIYDADTQTNYQQVNGELVPFGGGGSITIIDEDDDPDEAITGASDVLFKDADVTDLGTGGVRIKVSQNIAKGDLTSHNGTRVSRRAVGLEGQYLRARAAQSTGLAWESPPAVGEAASGARVHLGASQSIPNTTLTPIAWPVEDFDTDAYHSASGVPERFTAAIAGKYVVGCTIRWDSNAVGSRGVYIVVNAVTGTRRAAAFQPATANLVQNVVDTLELAAGDFVEFYVQQDSGGARDVTALEQITGAFIARVGVTAAPTLMRGTTWSRAVAIAVPVQDGQVRCPVNGQIVKVSIGTEGGAGSCVIDIWRDTHANYPPTVADSICGASKPTIAAGIKYEDAVLTGWTTQVNAGDWLFFHLESSSVFRVIFVQLFIRETQ